MAESGTAESEPIAEAKQGVMNMKKGREMTVEIASSEHVKWQMRTWNRLYQLFHDKDFFIGRLDAKAQAMIEEMFWLYVSKMSGYKRTGLDHIWSSRF